VITGDLGAGGFEAAGCSGSGDGALLQNAPRFDGCSPPLYRYIEDLELPFWMCPEGSGPCRERNYQGSLAETLACITPIGAGTCEFSQPLEAMRRALDGSIAANNGFLRDDAFLMVLILTDGDDCSAEDATLFDPDAAERGPLTAFRCAEYGLNCDGAPPTREPASYQSCEPRADSALYGIDEYRESLISQKADPGMVMVSVVSGLEAPVEVGLNGEAQPELLPVCQSPDATATPAVRLRAFAEAFPFRNTQTDVCKADLVDALTLVAEQYRTTLGLPCLNDIESTDRDLDMPGLQPECTAAVVELETREEVALPACEMAAADRPAVDTPLPCYWLRPYEWDGACDFEIRVEGDIGAPVFTRIRCGCE
jgi:hypothetical protein